jgi:tetratricopeptide (TPR) repeat protein
METIDLFILIMHLNVYIILNKEVPNRVANVSRNVQMLKTLCDNLKISTKFHTLAQPITSEIHENIKAYESRVKLDGITIEPFSKLVHPLTLHEISNFERHRLAFLTISEGSSDEYHFVIEDDIHILPIMEQNWIEMFEYLLKTRPSEHSFVLLSLANELQSKSKLNLVSYHELPNKQPIIPSKEGYFITPSTAQTLAEFTKTISFNMRHTLSYWLYNEKPSIYYPSKRLSFDGSKLGIFPSTVHPNNILIFNQEYMELLKMLSEDPKDIGKIHRTYKTIERLQSADAMHLYAVLLYQCKQYDEANTYFKKAIDTMVQQKGCINRQSELLHNAIEFYKHTQKEDLETYAIKPSKYKDVFKESVKLA